MTNEHMGKLKPPSTKLLLETALKQYEKHRDELELQVSRRNDKIEIYNNVITHIQGALAELGDL